MTDLYWVAGASTGCVLGILIMPLPWWRRLFVYALMAGFVYLTTLHATDSAYRKVLSLLQQAEQSQSSPVLEDL